MLSSNNSPTASIVFLKGTPTPAQLEAGNYKKHHRRFAGLDIAIENKAGSVREGTGLGGKVWRTTMAHDYGYIKGSLGVDGDHVDCFLGPNEDATHVYVVHQRKAGDWKKFDEDKCMVGFDSADDAKAAYLKNYDDKRFLGPVTPLPLAEFKAKVLATKDKPAMIKSGAVLLFLKGRVKAHERTLPSGRVIPIGEYSNNKSKKDRGSGGRRSKDTITRDMWADLDQDDNKAADKPKAKDARSGDKAPTSSKPSKDAITAEGKNQKPSSEDNANALATPKPAKSSRQNLIESIEKLGGITNGDKVLDYYLKEKIVTFRPTSGDYRTKHGQFLDKDVLQRASKLVEQEPSDEKTSSEPTSKEAKPAIKEPTGPIRSDDSQAGSKIAAKIEALEEKRNTFKAINKVIRKYYKKNSAEGFSDEKKAACAAELKDKFGFKDATAAALLKPDFGGRIGIPDYELTNLGANIRRLKKRAPEVEKVQATTIDDSFDNGVSASITDDKKIMIEFPSKPDEDIRRKLRANAFKFSNYRGADGAWVRKLTPNAKGAYDYHVKPMLKELAEKD